MGKEITKLHRLYIHSRPDTKSIFYVGIGKGYRPYSKRGRNNLWKKIVTKNQGIFHVEILLEGLTLKTAREIEIRLIKVFGRIDNGTGVLCNMTDGGDGCNGRRLTDEHKAKISAKMMGNRNNGHEPSGRKRKHHERIGLGKHNRVHITLNQGFLIQKVCPEAGIVLDEFLNCGIAEKLTGVNRAHINEVCNGHRKSAGGFYWKKSPDLSNLEQVLHQSIYSCQ